MYHMDDPAAHPDDYPVSVYQYGKLMAHDVLPPVHKGKIFHYTSHSTAVAILQSGVMHASRYDCMNDPGENEYGWSVIRDYYKTMRDEYSSRVQNEIDKVLLYNQREGWLNNVFVLSASTLDNNLNQFRFYGDVAIEIPGGVWTQVLSNPRRLSHDHRISWRPVIYTRGEAEGYIDHMLEFCARIIDAPPDWDFTDEGLVAMMAIRRLAMLIKHPEYASEREIRLVIESNLHVETDDYKDIHHRLDRGEDIYYVIARPETDGYGGITPPLVTSVRLGPTISDSISCSYMSAQISTHLGSHSPTLYTSNLPFYERGQKPIARP